MMKAEAKMSAEQQRGCPGIKRLSHNSKSQQKEAHLKLYNQKEPSKFAKYLIMGQAINSGVAGLGL